MTAVGVIVQVVLSNQKWLVEIFEILISWKAILGRIYRWASSSSSYKH